MSKKNKKHKKPNSKSLLILIAAQIIFISILGYLYFNSQQIALTPTQSATITVSEIGYMSSRGHSKIFLHTNNGSFTVENRTDNGNLPNSVLKEKIAVGDELEITYYLHNGIFESHYSVTGIIENQEVYRTHEASLASSNSTLMFWGLFALLVVFEMFWGAIFFFFVRFRNL